MVSRWPRRRALAGAGGASLTMALLLVGLAAWQWVTLSRVTTLRDYDKHQYNSNAEWAEVAPGLVLASAVVMFIVAASAVFASRSKEERPLIVFATCCSFAALILIVAGSLIVTSTDDPQLEQYVKVSLYDSFLPTRNGRIPDAAFRATEKALRCCGVEDAWDYRNSRTDVPASCCGDRRDVCDFEDHEVNARLGCAVVATESIKRVYQWAGASTILVGCACALGPALAWMLYTSAHSEREEDEPPDSDGACDD